MEDFIYYLFGANTIWYLRRYYKFSPDKLVRTSLGKLLREHLSNEKSTSFLRELFESFLSAERKDLTEPGCVSLIPEYNVHTYPAEITSGINELLKAYGLLQLIEDNEKELLK